MKNLRIRGKLAASFAVVLGILLGIGTLSIYNQWSLNGASVMVSDVGVPRLNALQTISGSLSLYRATESAHILAALPDDIQADDAKLGVLRGKIQDSLHFLNSSLTDSKSRTQLATIQRGRTDYMGKSGKLLDKSRRNLDAEASDDLMDSEAGFNTLSAGIQKMVDENSAAIRAQADWGTRVYSIGWMLTLLGLAIAAVSVGVILAALLRSIARPLGEMTAAMGALASGHQDVALPVAEGRDEVADLATAMTAFRDQLVAAERDKQAQTALIIDSIGNALSRLATGDLVSRVEADLTGPFAKLKTDFNDAMTSLQTTLVQVSEATSGINTGAAEIRQASDDLSQRTEQQAASLEQTAAAMEEITATVRQTAEDASRANGAVGVARTEAEHAGEVVRKAVAAMTGIERSSSEISEIISVIDGIAFQTNLLALNAGVEAARAGDAGRGFAVVAAEVRALAQRSADAARDVKARIIGSTQQVEVGVQFVGETGRALERIIGRIAEISTLVSSITVAAAQQSTGLQQISAAVAEMDGVTQQNAAMVEEATAAARNLAGESDELSRRIAGFRTGAEAPIARPASPVHRLQARAAAAAPRIGRPAPRRASRVAVAAAEDDWSEF